MDSDPTTGAALTPDQEMEKSLRMLNERLQEMEERVDLTNRRIDALEERLEDDGR